MAFAFRCKNCGRLVSSADAGERDTPIACPSCGYGVRFDPRSGVKTYEPENWEVLKDLPAKDRKALADDHGVDEAELIEEHVPAPAMEHDREPMDITREVSESMTSEDNAS
jgi:DNA-directed RNA polymerase subunit RPC12/RpoP